MLVLKVQGSWSYTFPTIHQDLLDGVICILLSMLWALICFTGFSTGIENMRGLLWKGAIKFVFFLIVLLEFQEHLFFKAPFNDCFCLMFFILLFILTFFFNCYLAVPRPTLGYFRGDSLPNPMLITVFLLIWPEGHWKPRNEVGSLSPVEHLSRVWTRNLWF